MKKAVELGMPLTNVRGVRPERRLALERLVRHEVALHRLLAVSRRAASTHMSALRRAKAALAAQAPLTSLIVAA